MYEAVPSNFYPHMRPDSVTHAGSPGWSQSPVPGWGANPARVGPPTLGAAPSPEAEERARQTAIVERELMDPAFSAGAMRQHDIAAALDQMNRDPVFQRLHHRPQLVDELQQAAKKVVWTTQPAPAPYSPYPVHRAVPTVHFNEVAAQGTAPWGRFPQQRSYEGIGAYYTEAPLRAVSGIGEINDQEEVEDSWRPLFSESRLPTDQREVLEEESTDSGRGMSTALVLGVLGAAASAGAFFFLRNRKPKMVSNRRRRARRSR